MADDPFIGFSTATVRFERLLGRGAMGAVYQGIQLSLQRRVAIKVIASHLIEDQDYLARFEREAHTVGRLVHPNIIACHDFGPCEGPAGERMYLMVMEYVDGWTLGQLAKSRKLQVRQVLEIHRLAAEGLHAAHAIGIIHRDIKPDNIMVTREGVAKLADFGLARSLTNESELTAAGSILGSPAFMSPEACRGEEPTAKSDIYSLGCSLMQTLTDVPVYPAQSGIAMMQMHIADPVPLIADRRSDLAQLQPLVESCLAKDPGKRAESAQVLARQLQTYIPTISRSVMAGRLEIKAGGSARVEAASGQSSIARTVATRAPRLATRPRRQRRQLLRRIGLGLVALVPLLGMAMALQASRHHPASAATALPADQQDPGAGEGAATGQDPGASPTSNRQAQDDPDHATLLHIKELIAQHQLEEAGTQLDSLVVAGQLKVLKNSVSAQLAQAWRDSERAISTTLDADEYSLPNHPVAVQNQLLAMLIPDRFQSLQERRTQLLAQARIAASNASRTEVAHPLAVAMPAPLPSDSPTAPAPVSAFDMALITGEAMAAGDPRLPDQQPSGAVRFARSRLDVHHRTQVLALEVPSCAHPGSGGAELLLRSDVPTTIAVSSVDAFGETQVLPSLRLHGGFWETVRIPVEDSARARQLTLSGLDLPLFIAGAVWSDERMPGWQDLHLHAGSLMVSDPIDEMARHLRLEHSDFPNREAFSLGVPEARKDQGQELMELLRTSLQLRPVQDRYRQQRFAETIEFYSEGSLSTLLRNGMRRAGSSRHEVYFHIVSTALPPNSALESCIDEIKEVVEGQDCLLPVLVLDCAASPAVRSSWMTFTRGLQTAFRGLPVIDLGQVPLREAAEHCPFDPASPEGRRVLEQSMAAAILELAERLQAARGRG